MINIDKIKSKIFEQSQLSGILSLWRFKDEKIVFTNGCFDVFHVGHLHNLLQSADLGTKLVVGLNTDSSIKRLKGDDRPINKEYDRALVLAGFSFVDAVVFFDTDTPYELIKEVKPDIITKGGDYKPKEVVGYDIVKQKGGEVVIIDIVEGFSSTSIIKKGGLV
jgi:rfaE bifunctional protein nucleotidyltransferase chain/domain